MPRRKIADPGALPDEPAVLADVLIQRPKPAKTRDRSWDARRKQVAIDLPEELIEDVKAIIEEVQQAHPGAQVRVKDIYRLFVEHGVEDYRAGKLRIQPKAVKLGLYSDSR